MSERDKRTVKIGGAIVLAALLFKFAIMPVIDGWRDARVRVAAYETRLNSLQKLLDERALSRQMLRTKYGDSVDEPLLSEAETRIVFPQAVQAALDRGGMTVQRIEVLTARRLRDVPRVSMLPVRVEGACNGDAIARVLAALRSADMLTVIERYELSMAAQGNRREWNVRMTLATPALQEGATP